MRFRLQPQSPDRANTREAQLQEAGSNPARPNQEYFTDSFAVDPKNPRVEVVIEDYEGGNLVMVKVKIKHLIPGTVFNAGPVAVRVLEHFPDGKTLTIADKCIADRPFTCQPFRPNRPEDWKPNDWRISTLRTDLNSSFLNSFDEAGGPILSKNIIPAEWDLTDSAGNNTYGSVTDKIGLLTEAMFRKYYVQGLLDLNNWWWLITPDAGSTYSARYVDTDGSLKYMHACYGIRGVRPALFVESEIEVEVEEDNLDIPPSTLSTLLDRFTTRQLVEELFRRIGTEKEVEEEKT